MGRGTGGRNYLGPDAGLRLLLLGDSGHGVGVGGFLGGWGVSGLKRKCDRGHGGVGRDSTRVPDHGSRMVVDERGVLRDSELRERTVDTVCNFGSISSRVAFVTEPYEYSIKLVTCTEIGVKSPERQDFSLRSRIAPHLQN